MAQILHGKLQTEIAMRVTHITRRFTDHEWGGSEETIWNLATSLMGQGHDARVVTSTALDPRSHQTLRGVDVQRHRYLYPVWGLTDTAREQLDKKGGNLVAPGILADCLWSGGDVLHAHTTKRTGAMVRVAAKLRRIPYVVTLHGGMYTIPEDERNDFTAPLERTFEWGRVLGAALGSHRVLDDADAVIAISHAEGRAVADHHPCTRVEHIPWGVDSGWLAAGNGRRWRVERSIPEGSRILLSVGRVDGQKNQLALVEALPEIRAFAGDVRVALVGPTTSKEYLARIKARIAELELEEHVDITGALPARSTELADAYAAADLFVLPSRHEPFGVVALEAWAAGKPVVASAVGGLADLIEPDKTGVLLTPPVDPSHLAEAVVRLLGDNNHQRALREAGLSEVAEYTWNNTTRRHLQLYDELIRQKNRRG
jgi:glycosyltransferase involved in cell wall biosynthesis